MSDSLRPHGLQHARPPCPSPTPRVHPNPCLLSRWGHPTISSSVIPFSSCPQSFPASGSFQMSQLFASVAKVLELQLKHQSFQWTPRTDLLQDGLVGHIAAAAAAKSLQSRPTLCDPLDGSPPGSPIPEYWIGLPFPSPLHESEVAQSCPTVSNLTDCSPPGSSVHGILQARIYWSRLPCPPPSGDRPNPRVKPGFPTLQAGCLPSEPPGKPFLIKQGTKSQSQ